MVDLLERDTELERIGSLVRDVASGSGRVVLIEGPAGIGKTALLDAACGLAAAAVFPSAALAAPSSNASSRTASSASSWNAAAGQLLPAAATATLEVVHHVYWACAGSRRPTSAAHRP